MPNSHPAAALRQRLREPSIIRSLGVFDVFSALVAQQEGLDTLFLGGFAAAASHLGLPDLGLLTMSEMADLVRRVTNRVAIPLIADGDTGYGDLQNVARTVREFERAGTAASFWKIKRRRNAADILPENRLSPPIRWWKS